MADKYTSLMALVLDDVVEDVRTVVSAASSGGHVDRHSPLGDGTAAQEVFWGGRMQKAVVRSLEDADGQPLLRAETYIGSEGLRAGLRRHARLLAGLAAALDGGVKAVRDLSAATEHDVDWLGRVAAGDVEQSDAIAVHGEGQGTFWVHSHGAARLDVPDLELYGLNRAQVDGAIATIRHVHAQVLAGGLQTDLTLPDETRAYLVPVLEAWRKLPLDWPGIGRAGQPRPGHEGPRATISVLHKRRFGRYRKDFEGVLERLPAG